MADFVAVLKKTLDGLGETTPQTRARVYEKARATVSAKLAAITPPPPASVADRQKKALEDAIATVESEYAPAKQSFEDPLEELENVFAALKEGKPIEPSKPVNANRPIASEPPKAIPPAPVPSSEMPPAQRELDAGFSHAESTDEGGFSPDHETAEARHSEPAYEDYKPRPRRRYGTAVAAALALVIVAGGGYAAWLNKDEVGQLLGLGAGSEGDNAPAIAQQPAAEQPAADAPVPEEVAAASPEPDVAETPDTPAKFTQRLNADGTETDAGPAGGEASVGEGTSVAALTPVAADQPPPTAAPASENPTPDAAAATPDGGAEQSGSATAAAAPADASAAAAAEQPAANAEPDQQIAVGQRAIFYEERTSAAPGSAEPGSIVWSEVQESPGGDAPPETAIRAEATIPGKDIQLRMTIRRNADKTLPASHIVEMIFLTPEGFEGGGIDNVLRIAMKSSEQDAGSPLLGIPAKIADGFFLVALNDTPKDIETNLGLLERQSWIDIPIVYKNGRRALFTMEKGIPGEKVFSDAIKAWQPKTAG